MSPSAVTAAYRCAAWLARHTPWPVITAVVAVGARIAVMIVPARVLVLRRNLERAHGRPLGDAEARRAVARSFAAYGRYWAESFRLPVTSPAAVDAGMDFSGYDLVMAAQRAGTGPIVVLPHLGGWEWAAFWLTRVLGHRVTVVVEPIEPPELRDFFLALRTGLGMNVVMLGPHAGAEVTSAIARGDIVCLLSDRDIDGTGVAVEFFGETTTVPAGPAALALRTGATLLPAAIYFDGNRHRAVVRPAVPAERHGAFRADTARIAQTLTHELEHLIAAAPEQWHLLQPNWPSDHEALRVAGYVS